MTEPTALPAAVDAAEDYEPITLTGELVDLTRLITKQGNPWMTGALVCADGRVPIEVFPVPYVLVGDKLIEGATVEVSGRVDKRDAVLVRVTGVTPAEGEAP